MILFKESKALANASEYYKALRQTLPEKWRFLERNRRPPRDPVNALLSLGYVLTGGEIRKVVQRKGLDPAIGFLHATQQGRESLILDLLEPLRPDVVALLWDYWITPLI